MPAIQISVKSASSSVNHTNSTPRNSRSNERNQLLLMATDRFCGVEGYDRLTLNQYKEAFYSLIGTASELTAAKVARQLSDNPYSPREAILYLAAEPINIARPVLRRSQSLTQLDMVRLVERCGIEHARILATRPDLGPSIISRLRRFNDAMLNMNLERNAVIHTAEMERSAPALFEKITASTAIIAAKKTQSTATNAAAEDKALPLRNVKVTISRKSEEIRRAFSNENVAVVKSTTAENTLLKAAARGGRIPSKKTDIPVQAAAPVQLRLSSEKFGKALERAALKRSHQTMATLMKNQFGFSLATCHQVLADKVGDTFAVMMKAAELNDAMANRISLLSFPTVGLSVQNTKRAMRFYAQLETASCLEAVVLWPREKSGQRTHQSYLAESATDQKRSTTENSRTYVPSSQELQATG